MNRKNLKTGIQGKRNIAIAVVVMACLAVCLSFYSKNEGIESVNIDLQQEVMMQWDRLEGLRTGKIPMSRFAKPEFVHNEESLIFPSDKDPLDIVLRRTRALYDDLSKSEKTDLTAKGDELSLLEKTAARTPVSGKEARMNLYIKACALRRQIAFSNPLLDFDQILFIKHKKNKRSELGGDHIAGQYYGMQATKEDEGLFILSDAFGMQPKVKDVINGKLPQGACLSPELSFDGKKILFAYTAAEGYVPAIPAEEDQGGLYNYSGLECSFTDRNVWHIYSINTDGTGLKQLTFGAFNDFDPCWLPDGRIVFISDRRGGFGRCHMTYDGGAPWFTYTLHRMDADGSRMVRLSHHETCEWQPSILHNGLIVYTRWDYVDRGFFQAHHPWTTTPDGRNALSTHGNYPVDWQDRPCAEFGLRAIPQSDKLISVAIAHHGQTYGTLVMIDPESDDDDAMSQVKMITPDERLPETEYGYFCREASYSTPWPLSEDYYLCVFGYPDKEATDGSVENYGIYLLDAFGNMELIYRDEKIACMDPVPVKVRPTPPVIPDFVEPLRVDMNQKRMNLDRPEQLDLFTRDETDYDPAIVSIMNVYDSREKWPENIKIKELRIVQVLPKSTPGRNNPAIGYGTEKNARAVLGTVPVEEDGSARFYLRPYIPVYFQALDEEGKAIQSMRSDVYAAPHEQLSCVGCHENRRTAQTPNHNTMALAMKREPSVITPEPEGTNPFNYMTLVQPIWDKHCVDCHARSNNPKAIDLSGTISNEPWVPSYRNLKPFAFFYDGGGQFTPSKTYPGKFGANASRLYRVLNRENKSVKLSPEEMRRIIIWLDCNSDFYGTYERIDEQRLGMALPPTLE
jgi:hypothetical protein